MDSINNTIRFEGGVSNSIVIYECDFKLSHKDISPYFFRNSGRKFKKIYVTKVKVNQESINLFDSVDFNSIEFYSCKFEEDPDFSNWNSCSYLSFDKVILKSPVINANILPKNIDGLDIYRTDLDSILGDFGKLEKFNFLQIFDSGHNIYLDSNFFRLPNFFAFNIGNSSFHISNDSIKKSFLPKKVRFLQAANTNAPE